MCYLSKQTLSSTWQTCLQPSGITVCNVCSADVTTCDDSLQVSRACKREGCLTDLEHSMQYQHDNSSCGIEIDCSLSPAAFPYAVPVDLPQLSYVATNKQSLLQCSKVLEARASGKRSVQTNMQSWTGHSNRLERRPQGMIEVVFSSATWRYSQLFELFQCP